MDSNTPNTSQDIQEILQDTPPISENKKKKSIVHNHFTLDEENNKYQCNYCSKSYQIAKDGSTSSLRKHLKVQHNDKFLAMDQLTDALNKLEISETLVNILLYLFYIFIYIIKIINLIIIL